MRRSLSKLPRAVPSSTLRTVGHLPRTAPAVRVQQRPFLTKLFGKTPASSAVSATPILDQTNLFHPLSSSPLPGLREKAQRIKTYALCPASLPERVPVAYDCPDCGFPTHASQEMWEAGKEEHQKYCERLREWNEDEHDLRSGRVMSEFEDMPGPQPYESTPSFTSWDTLFFTRDFKSINTDRSLRHVTKLLTYPMTIGAVLHQNGPFTRGGEARVTREGSRSFAALHSTLHLPPGSTAPPPTSQAEPPFRIFILGARAESSLPPTLWLQLTHLFPTTNFQLYFIGPEACLPKLSKTQSLHAHSPAPAPHDGDASSYGVPSRTINVSPSLSLITLQTTYSAVHEQFGPFDPYSDVFFSFSPGLGFPAQEPEVAGQGLVQAETTWNETLQQILSTKCPVFFTAFSPADLQRDVNALSGLLPPASPIPQAQLPVEPPTDTAVLALEPEEREARLIEGVTDEYDVVLSPGANRFASEKWEIADWDPRVGVKTNWGIWGIRGKRYEIKAQDE